MTTDADAPDPMTIPEPTDEHRFLLRMVGDWTYASECSMGPDQPPMAFGGESSVRALGELWIIEESTGQSPGGTPTRSIITLGFDPMKGKFVGTFVASMMTYQWPYEGVREGNSVLLDSVGPSFTDPSVMADYRDTMEIVDDDHRILHAQMPGPDGGWVEFMTTRYTRVR